MRSRVPSSMTEQEWKGAISRGINYELYLRRVRMGVPSKDNPNPNPGEQRGIPRVSLPAVKVLPPAVPPPATDNGPRKDVNDFKTAEYAKISSKYMDMSCRMSCFGCRKNTYEIVCVVVSFRS